MNLNEMSLPSSHSSHVLNVVTEDNWNLLHKLQAAPTENARLLGLLCTTKASPISSATHVPLAFSTNALQNEPSRVRAT